MKCNSTAPGPSRSWQDRARARQPAWHTVSTFRPPQHACWRPEASEGKYQQVRQGENMSIESTVLCNGEEGGGSLPPFPFYIPSLNTFHPGPQHEQTPEAEEHSTVCARPALSPLLLHSLTMTADVAAASTGKQRVKNVKGQRSGRLEGTQTEKDQAVHSWMMGLSAENWKESSKTPAVSELLQQGCRTEA